MRFEIYTRADGKHGYRLKGSNGEVMAQAEGFHSQGQRAPCDQDRERRCG